MDPVPYRDLIVPCSQRVGYFKSKYSLEIFQEYTAFYHLCYRRCDCKYNYGVQPAMLQPVIRRPSLAQFQVLEAIP